MTKKPTDNLSKRQIRKDELRQKERRQRTITVSAVLLIAVALLAMIIVPSVQRAANPAGEFERVTPQSFPNEDGTRLGDPQAKVKIELFEDFQCSACRIYAKEIEPELVSQLVATGQVYYEFRQYPFLDDRSTVKTSDRTAMASECAAEQNRFWDYKNILFTNQTGIQGQFSDVRLIAFAKSLGLDQNRFEACLNSNSHQAKIDADIQFGDQLGVNGTPSVYVNGIIVAPGKVPTFAEINQAVQEALQNN